MIRRLWFVLAGGWSIVFLLAQPPFKESMPAFDRGLWMFLTFMPWLIGYGLLLVIRFILRGNPRKKVFQPRPY
jgi:hypothetical protein